ncbi:hypothetical protein GX50_06324 [[Emmonsia] crescens]|uniref:Uncharacterized protein n=1 Tax=[Emmonsia] crescens TaxID=73230 RepID=A0A2B7ZCI6_9EURO|nr:hypothetical protein GX50_06324 [Emmonsia crescens]
MDTKSRMTQLSWSLSSRRPRDPTASDIKIQPPSNIAKDNACRFGWMAASFVIYDRTLNHAWLMSKYSAWRELSRSYGLYSTYNHTRYSNPRVADLGLGLDPKISIALLEY